MNRLKRLVKAIQEAWPEPPKLYRIPEKYVNPHLEGHPMFAASIVRFEDVKACPKLQEAWDRAKADNAITEVEVGGAFPVVKTGVSLWGDTWDSPKPFPIDWIKGNWRKIDTK